MEPNKGALNLSCFVAEESFKGSNTMLDRPDNCTIVGINGGICVVGVKESLVMDGGKRCNILNKKNYEKFPI